MAKELGLVDRRCATGSRQPAGKLNVAVGKVVTPEQMGLSRLRAENIRLKRECEILKKRWRTSREKRCEVRLDWRATP